ncbi:chemotaxis protein CheW [Candidatus Formimonas warabiya]|uniref:Chemotaxis protein CheW n=1 Tax=Formimonas warabiya TaxID=1761012 RepID=A0A3G1KYD4_FORW1|nr:chemotaxis protein CheW [Candidatus Formimonas warabiya]ATW27462.1 chemotaxis protein CheW [Candidatus Formimonas warabiya]
MAQEWENTMEPEEDTQKNKYLTFVLGKEEYGIEIKHVIEIVGMQSITKIPELPDYMKGIINLRGKIIPVIDVRLRFMKDVKEYNDRTCIIVIQIRDVSVGLIVDNVAEVLSISQEDIVPPPQLISSYHQKYIKGIGKVGSTVKLVLDCDKLLSDEEVYSLSEVS